MEAQVTNIELARRLLQAMAVVLLLFAALGYALGIEVRTVLLIEALFLLFTLILTIQFIWRGHRPEDLSKQRIFFYFVVVPVVMACATLVYLWLQLSPWLAVVAFPFAVLALNTLYSVWAEARKRT